MAVSHLLPASHANPKKSEDLPERFVALMTSSLVDERRIHHELWRSMPPRQRPRFNALLRERGYIHQTVEDEDGAVWHIAVETEPLGELLVARSWLGCYFAEIYDPRLPYSEDIQFAVFNCDNQADANRKLAEYFRAMCRMNTTVVADDDEDEDDAEGGEA